MQIIPYIPVYLNDVAAFMLSLQEYLVSIDPAKSLKTTPGGNIIYTHELLEKIKDCWAIFLAKEEEKIVGLVAWNIREQTEIEKLWDREKKMGDIIELIVSAESRWLWVWSALMEKMEEYFKQNGCNWFTVECFVPNISAHAFYEKHGYKDRSVYMTKSI